MARVRAIQLLDLVFLKFCIYRPVSNLIEAFFERRQDCFQLALFVKISLFGNYSLKLLDTIRVIDVLRYLVYKVVNLVIQLQLFLQNCILISKLQHLFLQLIHSLFRKDKFLLEIVIYLLSHFEVTLEANLIFLGSDLQGCKEERIIISKILTIKAIFVLDATNIASKYTFLFRGHVCLRVKIELKLYFQLVILALQLGYHTVFFLYLLLDKGSVEMNITCLPFNLKNLIFSLEVYYLSLIILLYPLKNDSLCCLNHLFFLQLLNFFTQIAIFFKKKLITLSKFLILFFIFLKILIVNNLLGIFYNLLRQCHILFLVLLHQNKSLLVLFFNSVVSSLQKPKALL